MEKLRWASTSQGQFLCAKRTLETFLDLSLIYGIVVFTFSRTELTILALLSDAETIERLKNILMVMEQRMMLRGSAGELLRSAVTPFIQNMSEARFPCHQDAAIIDLWKMIIGNFIIQRRKIVCNVT